jgi:hypothetical protein
LNCAITRPSVPNASQGEYVRYAADISRSDTQNRLCLRRRLFPHASPPERRFQVPICGHGGVAEEGFSLLYRRLSSSPRRWPGRLQTGLAKRRSRPPDQGRLGRIQDQVQRRVQRIWPIRQKCWTLARVRIPLGTPAPTPKGEFSDSSEFSQCSFDTCRPVPVSCAACCGNALVAKLTALTSLGSFLRAG